MPIHLLAWGFLAWSLYAGYASFSENRYHHEFDAQAQATRSLGAGETVAWEFERASSSLDRLEIFVQVDDHAFDSPVGARLFDVGTGVLLRAARSEFVADQPRLRFQFRLDVSQHTDLRLEIDGSEETERAGLRLVYSSDRSGMVQADGLRRDATSLNHLWRGQRRSPTRGTIAVGLLLFLWIAWRTPGSLGRSLALGVCSFGVTFVLAWDLHAQRVGSWPWHYWPDYSAMLARRWFELLSGELTWNEFTDVIASCRKGHVLLVPALLGVLQFVFSLADAFFLVVTLFALGTWGLAIAALQRLASSRLVVPVLLALLACNSCVLRAVGSLQTDIVGIFLAMTVVMCIGRLWATRSTRELARYAVWTSGALIATAFTRLALSPLLLLPLLPLGASLRRGSSTSRIACGLTLCVPPIVVASTWLPLGAFDSVELARRVAAEPRYVDAFQWGGFLERVLRASHVLVPVVLVTAIATRTRARVSRQFWAASAAALLLLGLLAGGRVVPWMRFQAPVFAVLFLASLASYESVQSRRAGAPFAVAVASVGIVVQIWDLARRVPLFF